MRGKAFLFWGGVIFTLAAPIIIGHIFKNDSVAWVAALCGAFVTFMARIDDLAELSFGPLKAKMRDTINEANATIEQLRNIAASFAKTILTDLMAGGFADSMNLKSRLDLHDQIISDLNNIGVSETAVKDAKYMWSKGICIIYHRAIRRVLGQQDTLYRININAPTEVLEASRQFQNMLNFDKWQAPTPDEMEAFIESKGLMTEELSNWISDYRHFVETGEIRRRELLEKE